MFVFSLILTGQVRVEEMVYMGVKGVGLEVGNGWPNEVRWIEATGVQDVPPCPSLDYEGRSDWVGRLDVASEGAHGL